MSWCVDSMTWLCEVQKVVLEETHANREGKDIVRPQAHCKRTQKSTPVDCSENILECADQILNPVDPYEVYNTAIIMNCSVYTMVATAVSIDYLAYSRCSVNRMQERFRY